MNLFGLLLIAFVFISTGSTLAQTPAEVTIRIYCGPTPTDSTRAPLFVVNYGKKSSRFKLTEATFFLNPNWLESLEILKDKHAISKYRNEGVNGVIIVRLKDKYIADFKRALAGLSSSQKNAMGLVNTQ